MARHEPNIRASAPAELDADELLPVLAGANTPVDPDRQHAIACCLSGSDGWEDAARQLGGAFASGNAGLREHKAD